MAEVIHVFSSLIGDGHSAYLAQVCGRPAGNIWEGWIEFVSRSEVRRTRRETTQPNRDALAYWASGLSPTYLEGALNRAGEHERPLRQAPAPEPYFTGPAPSLAGGRPEIDRAVLDPFSVGAKGEALLRSELGALRGWHLRNIARAYGLVDADSDLEALSAEELVELIVDAVAAN